MGVLLLLELGVLLDESEVSLVMVDFNSQSCALIKGVKMLWPLAWSVFKGGFWMTIDTIPVDAKPCMIY